MDGIPSRVELGGFVWTLGGGIYADRKTFMSAVREWLEDEEADEDLERVPDFDATVIPVARVGIAYWGLGEGYEYESMYAIIDADDPKGFTLADLLFKVNNATCEALEDADHRYLERITLLTPDGVAQRRFGHVPWELQELPVFFLECGS